MLIRECACCGRDFDAANNAEVVCDECFLDDEENRLLDECGDDDE